jgi:predicted enzyme related to lactoylglutathione lyase
MSVVNALASLAVRDVSAASAWYEQFLGPSTRPMQEVAEWQLPRGGALQVYTAPERAGRGSCTLIVDDIDDIAERLHSSGVAPDAEPAHTDQVDTVMIKDPDGNSIAFASPKDPSLAR